MFEVKTTPNPQTLTVDYRTQRIYEYFGAPNADGVTEKTLAIELHRNALVEKYEVVLGASPAHAVAAGEAGQVRATKTDDGLVSCVIDFGTLRTVSAVFAPLGADVRSVSVWMGSQFAKDPVAGAREGLLPPTLTSEVRTERLQVILGGTPSTEILARDLVLILPESPSGIELRIDGGAVAFAQVPAAIPTADTELSTTNWNKDGMRIVDIGPALRAVLGNPLDETPISMELKLTSRAPGRLDLQKHENGQIVNLVRRAKFNGDTSKELAFDSEGRISLSLDSLPVGLTVLEAKLTVVGKPASERVTPAVGPNAPSQPFAILDLNSGRAVCMRLDVDSRIGTLLGLRVPLSVGSSGCEVAVALWKSKNMEDQTPVEPVKTAVADSLRLDPGDEQWRTFRWKQPLPVPGGAVLWAVVSVSRGDASLALADATAGPGAVELRWGAPAGPWHELPDTLLARQGHPELPARGRIRLIGAPKPDRVFPPIELTLRSAIVGVVPGPKGVGAVLKPEPSAVPGPVVLDIVNYAAGTVTIRDLDVVSTD